MNQGKEHQAKFLFLLIPIVSSLVFAGAYLLGNPDPEQTLDEYLRLNDAARVGAIEKGQLVLLANHTRICMEARGLRFEPLEVEAERPWYLSLSPLEYARLAGFGVVEVAAPILYAEEDAQPDPNLRYMDSLEPAQRSLFQTSLGICQDEANETVFGPQNQLWLTLQPAVHSVRLAIEASPEYAAALLKWRECMKPLDLHFQEPDDVSAWLTNDFTRFVAREVERLQSLNLPLYGAELTQLREKEISVAVTYYTCNEAMDVAMLPVRRSLETDLINTHRLELEELQRLYDELAQIS